MKKEARPASAGMNTHHLKKYLFWLVLILLLILSYIILKPYLLVLISAFILAYLFRPIYKSLEKYTGKTLAALICVFILVTIIVLSVVFILGNIISQSYAALTSARLESVLDVLSSQQIPQKLGLDFGTIVQKTIELTISLFSSVLAYLPSFLLTLVIAITSTYLILVNWSSLSQGIKEYIPLKNKEEIIKEIGNITHVIVYGSILIGLLEFVVASIGFYFLGINLYFLLSAFIFFSSFIPGGPVIVWLPLAAYYLLSKNYPVFIGLLILGIILSLLIDYILRIKIIGERSGINPILMLMGLIGGISAFGIFGFLIGPLVLFYTLKLLEESLKQ